MEWTDDVIVLSVQKYGEGSAILEVLSRSQGRHKGLVRGATSTRMRSTLQPGNSVRATWKARLAEHLGTFSVELSEARAAAIIDSRHLVLALSSLCAVAAQVLPEREAHADIYDATRSVLDLLTAEGVTEVDAARALVHWELGVLGALGFGLDLTACAVTGATEGLVYVSPRSGRAVSEEGAGDYADRLLILPAFLGAGAELPVEASDVLAGFKLTGHFLDYHLCQPQGQQLPPARERFLAFLRP